MKSELKTKKGFTLVELIVVIAILALLAVGAVIFFMGIQANSRRALFLSDSQMLVRALNDINGFLRESNRITDHSAVEAFIFDDTFAFPSLETARVVITFDSAGRTNMILSFIYFNNSWQVDTEAIQSA
jgi:prepilin-type N-terminal cleavage/methylation domain-containing protein